MLVTWVLASLAALHLYWAVGGRWPGHDKPSLAAKVIGGGQPMPGPIPCVVVAVALLIAAAFVAAAHQVWPTLISERIDRIGAGFVAVAFALRGVGGFFEGYFRPAIRADPYEWLSRWVYSPLCVGIATAIAIGIR